MRRCPAGAQTSATADHHYLSNATYSSFPSTKSPLLLRRIDLWPRGFSRPTWLAQSGPHRPATIPPSGFRVLGGLPPGLTGLQAYSKAIQKPAKIRRARPFHAPWADLLPPACNAIIESGRRELQPKTLSQ